MMRLLLPLITIISVLIGCSDSDNTNNSIPTETKESILSAPKSRAMGAACPEIHGQYRCKLYPKRKENKEITLSLKKETDKSYSFLKDDILFGTLKVYNYDLNNGGAEYHIDGSFQDHTTWIRSMIKSLASGGAGLLNSAAPTWFDKDLIKSAREMDLGAVGAGYIGSCSGNTLLLQTVVGRTATKEHFTKNSDGSVTIHHFSSSEDDKDIKKITDTCELISAELPQKRSEFIKNKAMSLKNSWVKWYNSPDTIKVELKNKSITKPILLTFERMGVLSMKYKFMSANYKDSAKSISIKHNFEDIVVHLDDKNVYGVGASTSDLKIGEYTDGVGEESLSSLSLPGSENLSSNSFDLDL